ncbi:hypothetical protein [Dyella sp.]|uniref:hypothetical protein n=1 Tax=Dyella sp. TaxID=1869338 RepID=UPI002D79B55A|nr:hypothetical protein [Dyella sp.]HET7332257.1 hypothetical protein [Dyella sp.]
MHFNQAESSKQVPMPVCERSYEHHAYFVAVHRQKPDKIDALDIWHSAGVASPVTRSKDKLCRNQEHP